MVVDFAFVKCALLDLDLLVEHLQLFISFDELSTEDIALIDDHLVILSLLLLFLFRLCNDVFKPGDIALLCADHLLATCDLLADLVNVVLQLLILLSVTLLLLSLVRY